MTSVVSDKSALKIFIMTRTFKWNSHGNHIHEKKIMYWILLGNKHRGLRMFDQDHACELNMVWSFEFWYWNKSFINIWNNVPRQFLKLSDVWVSPSSRTHDVRSLTQNFCISRSRWVWSETSWTYVFVCNLCEEILRWKRLVIRSNVPLLYVDQTENS